jgi:hypothetical protein
MGPAVTDELEASRAATSLVALCRAGAPGAASPIDLEIAVQELLTEILSDGQFARHVLAQLTALTTISLDNLLVVTGVDLLARFALRVELEHIEVT